jgi:hypothetical protein
MNATQFSDPSIASELIETVNAVIEDETNAPTSILESNSDWYIRTSVHLKGASDVIRTITVEAFLMGLGAGNDISGPDLSDTQAYLPEKKYYDLQVHFRKRNIPEGVYRASAVITLWGDNNRSLLLGYTDIGIVQIYSSTI